ncbi:hypothetical protein [Aeromonas dhakensis]|uniref:hypothetical protein n=1 Tax=Aeromonas dhakensis TaxID=196024 RepID=UPI0023670524|nr:hypothetical protein [Aeromonas dhakensis]WDF96039.1 hypothetical protein PUB92_06765 [Aeromonas dhakensis]BEE10057.1 hypothetical protein VAWG003_28660 [Aeromonas dhakensis]BEE26940.1 hypothetical protein VAWG005_28680 [Aeromonas dhakensis]
MQISTRPMPLPGYGNAYSKLTPEQLNQGRDKALDKRDEYVATQEEKETTRRTLAVSYTEQQQDKAAVDRYLQASGQESDEQSAPTAVDLYRMEERHQQQQQLGDYLQYRQSTIGKQLAGTTGAEDRKGNLLDTRA